MLCILITAAFLRAVPVWCNEFDDFGDLSLDDLLNTVVISGARRGQKLAEAPNAIYVITEEDIRRSGAVDLPDVLRMVPGVDVVNFSGNSYGVSARGFNEHYAQRLLVMVDGRNIYKTFFGNVFWEDEQVFIEDIKQIEVMRGPGATMWGANSVTGVINIITKDPEDEQGFRLTGKAGNRTLREGVFRFSDRMSENLSCSITGGYREGSGQHHVNDSREISRANVKVAYAPTANSRLLFTAGFNEADFGIDQSMFTARSGLDGKSNYQMLRWDYEFAATSQLYLLAYRDYIDVRSDDGFVNAQEVKHSLEVQHSFEYGERNYFMWGGRYCNTRVDSNLLASGRDYDDTMGFFAQTEVSLAETLRMQAGLRFEDNSFTGGDWSPRLSLRYTPVPGHHFRLACSRAFRTPSTNEARTYFSAVPIVALQGNDDLNPEKMTAWELGYRTRLFDLLDLNIECYYNELNDVIESALHADRLPITMTYENAYDAIAKGVEISLECPLSRDWTLRANYTWQEVQARHGGTISGSPKHKCNLWLSGDVFAGIKLDVTLHYVDSTSWPGEPLSGQDIDEYFRLDVRIARSFFNDRLELSLTGQNLTDRYHPEVSDAVATYEIERLIYGACTVRF